MLSIILFSADTLTESNLKALSNELNEVRDMWFSLGVQLEVPLGDLRAIRTQFSNPADCLIEMLSYWLTMTAPPPTWQRVVDALNSPSIAKPNIADKIRGTYCTDNVGMF